MITETRYSRTSFVHSFERHPRRRHHTLDNATLDQFNFICVPVNLDDKSTMGGKNGDSTSRRVRFQLDLHDRNECVSTQSTEDVRVPEGTSIHRVEFRVPIQKDPNPWLNVECSSIGAKTRSLTSQKIDVSHPMTNTNHATIHLQGVTSLIESETDSVLTPSSTVESDKAQSEWYKEVYSQIHKAPENQRDVIRVKLPPTRCRSWQSNHRRDEQINPYRPTYTFPSEFDGNLKMMEDYIRNVASQSLDEDEETDRRFTSNSPLQPKDPSINEKKVEQNKSNHQVSNPSVTSHSHSTSRTSSSTATDDEQKSVYKRILRGGEIPSSGLHKLVVNNREKPNSVKPTSPAKTSPISKALALHNFHAQTDRELSFKKGETLLVKRRINDDWLEGEHQGVSGIFPLNHVELFPIEIGNESPIRSNVEQKTQGEAIVKFDFIPQKTFELQLRKGDKVILLRRLNENWYEGRLNHVEGIFPTAYVETLREPPECDDSSDRSLPNDRFQSPTPVKPKSVLKNPSKTPVTEEVVSPTPMRKCQVLYDYKPQNADELEIHVGDIITIVEMCDDGWFCGLMEKSKHSNKMEFGTFPGNYVKLLAETD